MKPSAIFGAFLLFWKAHRYYLVCAFQPCSTTRARVYGNHRDAWRRERDQQPETQRRLQDHLKCDTHRLRAAPRGALSDIVIPSVFTGGIFADANLTRSDDVDDRVWVPQTDCLDFRPLCFCVSQGYYVNLLRFRGGGTLGCHFHPSPVHALTLKGSWGYKEHGWHAQPGTYVFEPPGETHTLVVDEDCDEMVALFHVTGALIYKDQATGETIGYDDVFTKLEKARAWYQQCGLGADYAEQFVR